MVEPDRQADLDRIAAEEQRVKAAREATDLADRNRLREHLNAQGRLESPR